MRSLSIYQPLKSMWIGLCLLLFVMLQPFHVGATQSTKLLFDQALQASRHGDSFEALSLWDQLLDLAPKDAVALSNRGNIRMILGDPLGAIEDQTMAIQILPTAIDPHLNRGIAEEALKRWEDAEIDYKWILDRDPDNAEVLYNLGNVKGAQANWSEAKALYAKASFMRPEFAMARSSEALAAYQLGEIEKAESQLRMIIRRYPMLADARAALSALLWGEGAFGEAESNWAAVIGLDSRYMQPDWLLDIRRWPPQPTKDLLSFLALESP